jgi:hypothetical protein
MLIAALIATDPSVTARSFVDCDVGNGHMASNKTACTVARL